MSRIRHIRSVAAWGGTIAAILMSARFSLSFSGHTATLVRGRAEDKYIWHGHLTCITGSEARFAKAGPTPNLTHAEYPATPEAAQTFL
ncbi:hypothetical protein J6590_036618 [Homalodisca vitripennis]|nr:hypothetical protein J6590_036618 [Homalodisca vitripennis]